MISNLTIIVLSLIAVVLKLSIAGLVYKKNRSSKVNILFSLIFVFQAIWDLGKALMWLSNDISLALIFAKLSYAGYVISIFIFPHFAWSYLKRKNMITENIKLWYLPMFLLLLFLWTTNFLISGLIPPESSTYGFGIQLFQYQYGSIYTYFFIWFQVLALLYTFGILLAKYIKTRFKEYKARLRYLMIGISFPILIGLTTGVILPELGYRLFPHNNILTTLMCVFIGIGILKYKFLSVNPLHEEGKLKINKKELAKLPVFFGNQYLVCTDNPKKSTYNIFLSSLLKKHYGLVITTEEHKEVRKKYNLKTTPIIRLTDLETDELSIGSHDIEQLYSTIHNFCENIQNSVILLDGFDYLIKKNSFSKVLFLIRKFHKTIVKNKCIMLCPAEKYGLSQKQQSMLFFKFKFLPVSIAKSMRIAAFRTKKFFSKKTKVVALGYDSAIESLIQELEYTKKKITIISPNIKNRNEKKISFVQANPLKKHNLEKFVKKKNQYVIFISLLNDSDTMLAINLVRSINEKAMIVANIHRTEFINIAEKAGADYVVPSSSLGGHLLAMAANNPNIIRWMMDAVTSFGKGIDLLEKDISGRYINKTVQQVDNMLGEKANIVAVKTRNEFKQIPEDDYKLKKNDVLLIVKKE